MSNLFCVCVACVLCCVCCDVQPIVCICMCNLFCVYLYLRIQPQIFILEISNQKKYIFTSPIVEENFTIKNRRKCKFQELTFDQFSKCLLKQKNTDVDTHVIILASNTWLFAA